MPISDYDSRNHPFPLGWHPVHEEPIYTAPLAAAVWVLVHE